MSPFGPIYYVYWSGRGFIRIQSIGIHLRDCKYQIKKQSREGEILFLTKKKKEEEIRTVF